ncbi:hypothetical protein AVEN_122961-1 [Araneus ventricosus]|uniref:Uncharacterized protein n=1 Tax=Araneus ventricosus TaxID=182803 RepID=A0A4Y2PWN2_ARAVE|nr:hypothetical protein AVEN_122961-1 [Araneus ventricosus]
MPSVSLRPTNWIRDVIFSLNMALSLPTSRFHLSDSDFAVVVELARHFTMPRRFLDFFYGDRFTAGLKVLQMLWRSIPDPFIARDELASVFSAAQNSRLEEEIRSFIIDVTGVDVLEERGFQSRKL